MLSEAKEQVQFEWIQDRFTRLSSHRYLKDHVTKVETDEDKTLFLMNCFSNSDLEEEEQLKRVTAGLLVDAALMTHQYVPLHNESVQRAKEKQLTVLAGDWYSSLYYAELSKLADVPLIRVFSGSIQKTNDAKIRLHGKDWTGELELEQLVTTMEATLIKNVGLHLGHQAVQNLAPPFLTYRRLIDMIEQAEVSDDPFGSARLSPLFAAKPEQESPKDAAEEVLKSLREVAVSVKEQLLEMYEQHKHDVSIHLDERCQELLKR